MALTLRLLFKSFKSLRCCYYFANLIKITDDHIFLIFDCSEPACGSNEIQINANHQNNTNDRD
ncbi:hypothetical protein PN36_09960 [Candidatus Thiomargarita nelsonii]|uniref:Uncharacterized protein n=1 Tax=Candidatus Thiomargarita nelsonii TaxID=1003181 RepID=A0A4E0QQZ3_9GAMM|nr:hypothetical protein PN36_09960 [Candidatus Thiomargarita nelsonii]